MPDIWDWINSGRPPQFPQGQPPPIQPMVQPPVFAQAPQMAQDIAAGVADPLLKAGNYLGGIMQGSQQFSWPETIQHGAALAMALAPGPGRAGEAAGALERGAAGVAKGAAEIAPTGIRAFHGSPYDFNQFDLSKIGTGEGAQAYGHGLYFAENPAVSESYRFVNSQPGVGAYPASLAKAADQKAINAGLQGAEAKRFALEVLQKQADAAPQTGKQAVFDAINNFDTLKSGKVGHGYEVNIRAQPEQFLDWDKPLSQQSPQVKEAMQQILAKVAPDKANLGVENLLGPGSQSAPFGESGAALHNWVSAWHGRTDAGAAQAMREAGIPGIRYLDQGSRGQGRGTHNYVVFNDQLIDILKKYGLIGALGGSMTAPYFARQGQQQ